MSNEGGDHKLEASPETTAVPEPNDETHKEKDVHYYLQMLHVEQERLLKGAALLETYSSTLYQNRNKSEETFGLLRSTAGQARLLATRKMQQFEDLCLQSLNPLEKNANHVTLNDLEGFWDMMYIQIIQINEKFEIIEQIRINNWKSAIHPKKAKSNVSTKPRK